MSVERGLHGRTKTYILVSQVLEQLQLTVCALGEDRRAEGLHDLLDGHRLAGQLVLCGTAGRVSLGAAMEEAWRGHGAASLLPDQPEGAHADGLKIRVPGQALA